MNRSDYKLGVSKKQLLEILREDIGSGVQLVDCRIQKEQQDYLVYQADLHSPDTKVIVKLAGPQAPIPCPFDRTAALHQLVGSYTTLQMAEVLAVDVTYQKWPWRYLIKRYVPGHDERSILARI